MNPTGKLLESGTSVNPNTRHAFFWKTVRSPEKGLPPAWLSAKTA
jgi:hypothetical protein